MVARDEGTHVGSRTGGLIVSGYRPNRIAVDTLHDMKREGRKIAMITAYDYPTGRAADAAGADVILVGDSLANTVLGLPDTLGVSMNAMIHHCAAVNRARQRAFLVADMPFLSFQVSPDEALRNAGRFLAEAGADAVKVEGANHVEAIERIVKAGIPVMGHLGYTPQSLHAFGHRIVQGKTLSQAEALCRDAGRLVQAGCFVIVLEKLPGELARRITDALPVPTIGIGSGPHCDGQVLVLADILGLQPELHFKHAKRYAEIGSAIEDAVRKYAQEVREGAFPSEAHTSAGRQQDLPSPERAAALIEGRQ